MNEPSRSAAIHGPVNEDQLTNDLMHTLPLEAVVADHQTGADGNYLPSRVISTVAPVVVRQNDPSGPRYQEGIGYSFLQNSPKYPGLCRLDDGTLVLTLSAALSGEMTMVEGARYVDEATRTEVMLTSTDNGMSWSQPQRIPGYRTTPMELDGRRLLLRGHASPEDEAYLLWFSEDGGHTWSAPEPVPPLPSGGAVSTDVAMRSLREGSIIRFLFHSEPPAESFCHTLMRPYDIDTHVWGEPSFFPAPFRSSEASMTRATNGDLVASLRAARDGIPAPSDHWRSIVTAYSTDDGRTWSEPAVHSLYGHVHHSLVTFPDGRILMTYAARIGELDGRLYHGHEAVFSHDHGRTWDWARRFILFRGTDGAMHSPQSVLMDDGRVVTVVMHPVSYTWRDEDARGNLTALSHVSAVIWQP